MLALQKKTEVDGLSEEIADLTLGYGSDGKVYLFVNGKPNGSGIELVGGGGDVIGMIDDNNNIVITGDLADGTYTFQYETADGTYADIGSLTIGEVKPAYTNYADPTSADWKTASRFGSSSDISSSSANAIVTNYIKCNKGDVIRIKGLDVTTTLPDGKVCRSTIYNDSKAVLTTINSSSTDVGDFTVNGDITECKPENFNTAFTSGYIRFGGTLTGTASDVIITINEEIE